MQYTAQNEGLAYPTRKQARLGARLDQWTLEEAFSHRQQVDREGRTTALHYIRMCFSLKDKHSHTHTHTHEQPINPPPPQHTLIHTQGNQTLDLRTNIF